MPENRKNHLIIDGGQVKEDDPEPISTYKPIPESDTGILMLASPLRFLCLYRLLRVLTAIRRTLDRKNSCPHRVLYGHLLKHSTLKFLSSFGVRNSVTYLNKLICHLKAGRAIKTSFTTNYANIHKGSQPLLIIHLRALLYLAG